MSTKQAFDWIQKSLREIRQHPRKWATFSLTYFLFIWCQSLFPGLGIFIAAIGCSFANAALFALPVKSKTGGLVLLGIFAVPLVLMWTSLMALALNLGISEFLFSPWTLPGAFFSVLYFWLLAHATGFFLQGTGIDASLRQAWTRLFHAWRPVMTAGFLMTLLVIFSALTQGWGWILTIPLGLTVVVVSFDGRLIKAE